MCSSVSSSSRPRNSRPRRRSFTVRNTLTVNGGLGERARIGKTMGGRESIDLCGAMLVDFEGFGKPGIRSMLFNESGGLVLGLVRYLCLPMISLAWVIEANTRPWVAVCSFVKLNLRLKLNLKLSLKLNLKRGWSRQARHLERKKYAVLSLPHRSSGAIAAAGTDYGGGRRGSSF